MSSTVSNADNIFSHENTFNIFVNDFTTFNVFNCTNTKPLPLVETSVTSIDFSPLMFSILWALMFFMSRLAAVMLTENNAMNSHEYTNFELNLKFNIEFNINLVELLVVVKKDGNSDDTIAVFMLNDNHVLAFHKDV